MRSSYRRIGEHIRLVDDRNKGLDVKQLLGLSISKQFIPSVANIIGTDMENYKIIRKNQFACSTMQVRRDKKMPVALLQEVDEAILSQAYPIFEVKDEAELLPEYLMMWFSRSEFDREACFHAVGGVRGSLEWEDFCEMQLPIPHPDKQREIVKEYNVIQNRIALNQQLIQKLEETAQAIYKQWFVDFEFPIDLCPPESVILSQSKQTDFSKLDYSKGYKSNGGEMVYNEELGKEIPKGWGIGKLGKLFDVINGYAFSSEDFVVNGGFPIIKITNIVSPNIDLSSTQYYSGEVDNKLKKCLVNQDDILISMTGSHMNQINSAVGKIGRYNYEFSSLLNQRVGKLKTKTRCNEFVFQTMLQADIQKEILMAATGSANQANISPDTIKGVDLVVPNETTLCFYEDVASKQRKVGSNYDKQNRKLVELKDLLLSKLATVD